MAEAVSGGSHHLPAALYDVLHEYADEMRHGNVPSGKYI